MSHLTQIDRAFREFMLRWPPLICNRLPWGIKSLINFVLSSFLEDRNTANITGGNIFNKLCEFRMVVMSSFYILRVLVESASYRNAI